MHAVSFTLIFFAHLPPSLFSFSPPFVSRLSALGTQAKKTASKTHEMSELMHQRMKPCYE